MEHFVDLDFPIIMLHLARKHIFVCVCVCVLGEIHSYLLVVPRGNSSLLLANMAGWYGLYFHLVSIWFYQLLGEGFVKGTVVVLLALSAINTLKWALEVEQMVNSQRRKADQLQ